MPVERKASICEHPFACFLRVLQKKLLISTSDTSTRGIRVFRCILTNFSIDEVDSDGYLETTLPRCQHPNRANYACNRPFTIVSLDS